jgi:hypothetical protein
VTFVGRIMRSSCCLTELSVRVDDTVAEAPLVAESKETCVPDYVLSVTVVYTSMLR